MENLFQNNTGLESMYLNGIPIVENRVMLETIFDRVRRVTSLAALADPYILKLPLEVRQMMQLHGDGDRITKEFLELGAKDILPVYQSRQRLIPEGVFGGKDLLFELLDVNADYSWIANANTETVKEVNMTWKSGGGFVTVFANETELGTFELNEDSIVGQEGLRGANQEIDKIDLFITKGDASHYLPSIDELLNASSVFPNDFDLLVSYWSSTEDGAFDAEIMYDDGGSFDSDISNKTATNKVKMFYRLPNDDSYIIGDIITLQGYNWKVWAINEDTVSLFKVDDDGLYKWSSGLANSSEIGTTSDDGLLNTETVYSLGNTGGAIGFCVDSGIEKLELVYDLNIPTIERSGLSWRQALVPCGDVVFPYKPKVLAIYNLFEGYNYENKNSLKVYEVTVKHEAGSADVDVTVNETKLGTTYLLDDGERNDDLRGSFDDISNINIEITNASEDFKYSLILNTGIPDKLPSPRFEFDSVWSPNEIIYRFQNMDNRSDDRKLEYSSRTAKNINIDTNVFDNIQKYLEDALRDYVLMKLYETVGYDKKYMLYSDSYDKNRRMVAYWVKNDMSLQSNEYAGYR